MDGRRGVSLVELLVALLLLEVAGAAALAAVLTGERVGRAARAGSAIDRARWSAYRAHQVAPACRGAPSATLETATFPATPERPALSVVVGCGP